MKSVTVSVVIPNYNGRSLLAKNLPAVRRACPEAEIIVTDDASTDDSVTFLRKNYPWVKLVVNSRNLRFAANCNNGVAAASGEIVVLLNSDVAPEKDFLQPLLAHFADPEVFSVGCREKDMIADKIIFSGRAEGEFRRGFWINWRSEDQTKSETFWTSGGSMAVDRQKWQTLGGMDTLFRPAYWEDIDLCWRARKKGWKIIFEPKAMVNHHHESTNLSALGRERMRAFGYKNQFLFLWKNGNVEELIQHLLWLPYHLTLGNLRTNGLLGLGFLLALKQLPEAVKSRLR